MTQTQPAYTLTLQGLEHFVEAVCTCGAWKSAPYAWHLAGVGASQGRDHLYYDHNIDSDGARFRGGVLTWT